ncbi:unannotated protein [freshwater metagenome]|uniref:Unannotated protein n=1 Tax=freshwater metagenome TaxID=449393 RepID=A0A6J6IBL9_9ZZZZ
MVPPKLGSKTITLFAKAGPRFFCVALSRSCDGAPPETIFVKRISDITVAGPHCPSTAIPTDL